jgi:hypothetical protein
MSHLEEDKAGEAPAWLGAMVRSFSPARWGLCLAGVILSALMAELALSIFAGTAPRLEAWWQDPLAEFYRLADHLVGKGSGTAVWRGCLLAIELSVVWGPVAGWIARAEFLSHRSVSEAEEEAPTASRLSATRFLILRGRTLCFLVLFVLCFACFLLQFGLLAGLFSRIFGWGIGAVLVAVLLPVALASSLMVALVLVGGLSYSIMPACLAAEGSDSFDAISRGYSYLLQRPFRFGWWWGLALAIAASPAAGVFWLLDAQPALVGSHTARWFLGLAGISLSLSLFWTLQSLVYLKLRRAVDNTPEHEIWDGPGDEAAEPAPAEASAAANDGQPADGDQRSQLQASWARLKEKRKTAVEATAPEAVVPKRTQITFQDTVYAGGYLNLRQLLMLLVAVLWTALVLGGGLLEVQRQMAPGQALTATTAREVVVKLAGERPGMLTGLAVGAVLLGALGVNGLSKRSVRMSVLDVVFGRSGSLSAGAPFARRTRALGLGSVVLLTAGVELFLVMGVFISAALQGTSTWWEVAAFGSGAAVLVSLGALGLGGVAVEGQPLDVTRVGTLGIYLSQIPELVASAILSLVVGLLRFVAVAGFACLTWLISCTSISWLGGDKIQWLRWGLNGVPPPAEEDGLYRMASWITGFWFLLILGLVFMVPLANALRWGVVCYLLGRQRREEIGPGQVELSIEERTALATPRPGKAKKEGPAASGPTPAPENLAP